MARLKYKQLNLTDKIVNADISTTAQIQAIKLVGIDIDTVGIITTGQWEGTPIDIQYGGTGLTSLGSALQYIRVNSSGTALEYATLTTTTSWGSIIGTITSQTDLVTYLNTNYLGINNGWKITGNTGINSSSNFIGTTDSNAFNIRTNNIERISVNASDNTTRFGVPDSITSGKNIKIDPDNDRIVFYHQGATNLSLVMDATKGLSSYNITTADYWPVTGSIGNFDTIRSGFGITANQFAPLNIIGRGNIGALLLTPSIIFKNSFSTNTTRMIIYDNTTTGAPISILPTDGNLLVGTATDTGYKLLVNGTSNLKGATRVDGTLTVYDNTYTFIDYRRNVPNDLSIFKIYGIGDFDPVLMSVSTDIFFAYTRNSQTIHLNRNTGASVADAGFTPTSLGKTKPTYINYPVIVDETSTPTLEFWSDNANGGGLMAFAGRINTTRINDRSSNMIFTLNALGNTSGAGYDNTIVPLKLYSTGHVTVNGTTDNGFTFEVTGTSKISGALTISNALILGSSAGTAGQVLTSAGAGVVPTWTTLTTGGVSSFNTRTGAVTLLSSDITTALGFTPYNSTNPSGYITSADLSGYLLSATATTTYVPLTRTLTINGTALDLSANRTWTVGDALVANPLSQFAATTSAQLAGVISDETGTNKLVFSDSPTLVTPDIGAASGTSLVLGGTLTASSLWDVQSTTKGILTPRMTDAQMLAISSPANGLEVFNTDYNCKMYYSNDWGWVSDSSDWKARNMIDYINELILAPADGFLTTATASGGVSFVGTSTNNKQVVGVISTLASASSRASIGQSLGATGLLFLLRGGRMLFETSVRIPTLSNGTERFQFVAGLSSTFNSISITNSLAFVYDEGGVSPGSAASANWQVVTMASSSRTWTTTSVAVTAGQFYNLKIVINAAGTSVSFYIDDVLVKTETNTIPTVGIGIMEQIYKSIGTTARTAEIDYIRFKQKFTTKR